MIGFHIWHCTLPFLEFMGLVYMKIVTIKSYDRSSKKKNHFKFCFNGHCLKWLFGGTALT
jgi:hypothetical protein